jgi:hypothetical protein
MDGAISPGACLRQSRASKQPAPAASAPPDIPRGGKSVKKRPRDERDWRTLLVELDGAHERGMTDLTSEEVRDELDRIAKSKKLSRSAKGRAKDKVRERVLYAIQPVSATADPNTGSSIDDAAPAEPDVAAPPAPSAPAFPLAVVPRGIWLSAEQTRPVTNEELDAMLILHRGDLRHDGQPHLITELEYVHAHIELRALEAAGAVYASSRQNGSEDLHITELAVAVDAIDRCLLDAASKTVPADVLERYTYDCWSGDTAGIDEEAVHYYIDALTMLRQSDRDAAAQRESEWRAKRTRLQEIVDEAAEALGQYYCDDCGLRSGAWSYGWSQHGSGGWACDHCYLEYHCNRPRSPSPLQQAADPDESEGSPGPDCYWSPFHEAQSWLRETWAEREAGHAAEHPAATDVCVCPQMCFLNQRRQMCVSAPCPVSRFVTRDSP